MKKDTFLRGAFVATICIILTKIMGAIYVIPFYSIVGPDGSVIYGAAYNIYAIFLNISTIGLPLAISKLVSEYHALGYEETKYRTYKLAGKIMIISSVVTTVLLFLFAPFLAKNIISFSDYSTISGPLGTGLVSEMNVIKGLYLINEITLVIRVSASAIFFVTLISMIRGYLQGMKYIQASSISQVIEQAVRVMVILLGSYLCIHIFGANLGIAIGVAVFGATIGAMAAYLYLRKKKNDIGEDEVIIVRKEEADITNKQLFKKIIACTIPLIVMQLIGTAIQAVDMFTVVRTLTNHASYSVTDASVIMNIVTTLGSKLNAIVSAIAMGVVVSLLPSLTADYSKGDIEGVKRKINKSLQILLYLTIPMAVGLSFLAEPVWNIFYGESFFGPKVFMVSIFTSVFGSLFTNSVIMLQSLSRYKSMYVAMLSGFIFNVIMNIPMMLLFHEIGLPIYYGNLVSVMIGFTITISICLYDLKKTTGIKYGQTLKQFMCIILAASAMYITLIGVSQFLPVADLSRGMSLVITGIYAIIGMIIYFGITYLTKTFDKVIGKDLLRELFKREKKQ